MTAHPESVEGRPKPARPEPVEGEPVEGCPEPAHPEPVEGRLPKATIGLAIFVKTPARSPVKTRLAVDLMASGMAQAQASRQATALYRSCLRAVEGAVAAAQRRCPGLQPYYAVAEVESLGDPRWRRWPCLAQGEGDLGERQAEILAALLARHDAAILLGSDLPWLSATQLDPALQALQHGQRLVVGASRDGGYYLFGSRLAVPAASWQQVQYSAPDTLQQLLAVLPAGEPVVELPLLADLDRLADREGLLAMAPARLDRRQRRLLRRLRSLPAP